MVKGTNNNQELQGENKCAAIGIEQDRFAMILRCVVIVLAAVRTIKSYANECLKALVKYLIS